MATWWNPNETDSGSGFHYSNRTSLVHFDLFLKKMSSESNTSQDTSETRLSEIGATSAVWTPEGVQLVSRNLDCGDDVPLLVLLRCACGRGCAPFYPQEAVDILDKELLCRAVIAAATSACRSKNYS